MFIGESVYIGTGQQGLGCVGTAEAINDFWKFDPATFRTIPVDLVHGPKKSSAIGFAVGNKGNQWSEVIVPDDLQKKTCDLHKCHILLIIRYFYCRVWTRI